MKTKLIRITTVPISLRTLLKGQLRFMQSKGFEVIGVSSNPESELAEVRSNEGVEVVALDMSRKITPIADLKSLWKMYSFFKKEKPQIVHTHTPKAGIVGMLAAKLAGVPIRLHTVAGLPLLVEQGNKRKVLEWVEKMTYACATQVYPNSKVLNDYLLDNQFAPADKLKVIGNGSSNGIDTNWYRKENIAKDDLNQLKFKLQIQESDFTFVFVGRLVSDKGINELVEAFSKMDDPNLKLVLVGPLESDLDPLKPATLAEIKTNKRILAVGFQNDVRPYFALADALVFPSYREGFPNVVMQAGAMGLPSIVTDINGSNEIIIEGENGTIIPVKNTQALHDAMCKLMSDKPYFDQLQSNARKMITSRYEQNVVWEAILQEYQSLIHKR